MGDLLWNIKEVNYNCVNLDFYLKHTDFTILPLHRAIFCFAEEETH